jgi:hypothetical protein
MYRTLSAFVGLEITLSWHAVPYLADSRMPSSAATPLVTRLVRLILHPPTGSNSVQRPPRTPSA